MLEQRASLLQEMTSDLSDIRQLEHEIKRMSEEIQATEREYQHGVEALRDVRRKTCLLGVFTAYSDNLTSQNEAFAEKIDIKVDALKPKETDPHLHPKSEGNELETTTMRQVRESCERIENFLHHTLQGSFGKDKTMFSTKKDQLWKTVERTLRENRIGQVLSAIEQLSQAGANAIREHTLKINLQQDAQKLRFKYRRGGHLTDASKQPTALQSVHQLLQDSQLQHVLRYVETEKHRNTVFRLVEGLNTTRGLINSSLKKYLGSEAGSLQLASAVVQAKLDLTADRAAALLLRQEAEALREKVAKGCTERDNLLAIHRKIQDFYDLAITLYILRSLSGHESEIYTLTTDLKGNVIAEVDRFASLSMPYLAWLYLDSTTKCSLLDLSINYRNHPAATSIRQPLQAVLSHLEFPDFKASECILHHCLQLKQELESTAASTSAQISSCQQLVYVSGFSCNLDNITDLCEKVKSQDKKEIENLLPRLQKRISKTAHASTECIKVKDHVQAWWEQPAQFVTPWLMVEDHTYQQWYNKWRIIATKIRQMQVEK
ncbi:hypothetical protein C0Q70_12949 [Pomacea canaliculata]|uniref:Uncharacterized protein n=1 Tax=Pomacea canaliculata TaxID=400727 RepID=A0A2T7P2X2_POMCA|nr:hypothetical protein C0Q70_12949 [Pomacea canaliculata]